MLLGAAVGAVLLGITAAVVLLGAAVGVVLLGITVSVADVLVGTTAVLLVVVPCDAKKIKFNLLPFKKE